MGTFERLVEKVRNNEAILWVGSGYSLYAGMASARTLREVIISKADEDEQKILAGISSLSEVAKEFVELRSGLKHDLQRIIYDEFTKSPKSIEFHEMLTEVPQIHTIVTTNYDTLFEQAYGNELFTIIKDTHIPLAASRRVSLYKIHGDVNSPESIIVTSDDYTNFFRSQDTPIWTKVKSLIAEKSIVFVGYSLEDQNIDYLFQNVIEKVGDFSNESFLVAPKMQSHKIDRLRRKNIQYLDMTGELFTSQLVSKIREHLLEDIITGTVDNSVGMQILKKNGMNPEITVSPQGTILSGLKSTDGAPFNLNISFSGINLPKLVVDSPHDEFEIPSDNIRGISSNFKGIKIPTISRITSLIVKPIPVWVTNVDLIFNDSDEMLSDVKMELFGDSIETMFMRFTHAHLKIELDTRNNNFTFRTNLFPSLSHTKRILNFLYKLLLGEEMLTVYSKESDGKENKLLQLDGGHNQDLREGVIDSLNYIEKLKRIERYYNVSFRDFDFVLYEDDIRNIGYLIANIDNSRVKCNSFEFSSEISRDSTMVDGMLEEDTFHLKLVSSKPLIVNVLNTEIQLERTLCIEIDDAYLINREEVISNKALGEKSTPIILGSRNEGIFAYFVNN